jgi:hypothetical protein
MDCAEGIFDQLMAICLLMFGSQPFPDRQGWWCPARTVFDVVQFEKEGVHMIDFMSLWHIMTVFVLTTASTMLSAADLLQCLGRAIYCCCWGQDGFVGSLLGMTRCDDRPFCLMLTTC